MEFCYVDLGKLNRSGIQFDMGHVFRNVTDVSVDSTGDLANSFAKELPNDIFPLTISDRSPSSGSFYTSLTINQFQSVYLIPVFPYVRSITVGDSCCTEMTLDPFFIQGMPYLKTIVIGENSYSRVKAVLKLQTLPRLESVTFRSRAFHDCNGFSLKSVPNLQTLIFGDYTFCGKIAIRSFTIGIDTMTTELAFNSLSKLQTLSFGRDCFYCYSSLTINSLPSLTSLVVKQGAFPCAKGSCSLSITKCSKLKTITVQSGAFKQGKQFQLSG